jgi:hypothetical protein
MTSDTDRENEYLTDKLTQLLQSALQRWRRSATADYLAFQPIVDLRLTCIEKRATALVTREIPPRPVSDDERRRAAWQLIREAVVTLRPSLEEVSAETQAAMERLPCAAWPLDLIVPRESHYYLTLFLAYVLKSHHNKHLAALFNLSERSVAKIRNQAIAMIARCIVHWESHADGCSSTQCRGG